MAHYNAAFARAYATRPGQQQGGEPNQPYQTQETTYTPFISSQASEEEMAERKRLMGRWDEWMGSGGAAGAQRGMFASRRADAMEMISNQAFDRGFGLKSGVPLAGQALFASRYDPEAEAQMGRLQQEGLRGIGSLVSSMKPTQRGQLATSRSTTFPGGPAGSASYPQSTGPGFTWNRRRQDDSVYNKMIANRYSTPQGSSGNIAVGPWDIEKNQERMIGPYGG